MKDYLNETCQSGKSQLLKESACIALEEQAKRDTEAKAQAEAAAKKAAEEAEAKRKKEAEEVARARRAAVGPKSGTPIGSIAGQRPQGKTIRDTIKDAIREHSGAV